MLDKSKDVVRNIVKQSKDLGFDHLSITIAKKKRLGTRVARGVICRENSYNEDLNVSVDGVYDERHASFQADFTGEESLLGKVKSLREKLSTLGKDSEYVPSPVVDFKEKSDFGKANYDESYSYDSICESIEKYVGPVRSSGKRVSGYLEASELDALRVTSSGVDVETRDNAMQVKFAVDNAKTLASGVGIGNVTFGDKGRIDDAIRNAVTEACEFSDLSENPVELAPGDYETVFHHTAVADLLPSFIWYGFFDKRSIDEGRSYLSNNSGLSFPSDLTLATNREVEVAGGMLKCPPVTIRGFKPEGMNLIKNGKVDELFVSPYWGKEKGIKETPYAYDGLPATLTGGALEKSNDWREIVKNTESGIFVNSLWYIRMVSPMDGVLTGMTRDGIYEIKDGKIFRAIKNMRWHQNPFEMFASVTDMSREKRTYGIAPTAGAGFGISSVVPSIKTSKFHFSSVTKF